MFAAAKDALTSKTAQAWANNLIGRYGRIDGLKLDSRNKTLEATCQLEGEVSPITVKIGSYTVESEGGKKYLRARDFTCTRPWLQNALNDFGDKQRVELPSWAAAAL
ncbi:MAG: hypothetical protein JWQ83_1132 [Lacunisphaera sp.]|nr:hypothetical protein [Lacunisphaera sp.]MDB6165992.1 hypothetical protein [Lacunisphaera sp.]